MYIWTNRAFSRNRIRVFAEYNQMLDHILFSLQIHIADTLHTNSFPGLTQGMLLSEAIEAMLSPIEYHSATSVARHLTGKYCILQEVLDPISNVPHQRVSSYRTPRGVKHDLINHLIQSPTLNIVIS